MIILIKKCKQNKNPPHAKCREGGMQPHHPGACVVVSILVFLCIIVLILIVPVPVSTLLTAVVEVLWW